MTDVGEDSKHNTWKERRKQQLREELTEHALALFRVNGITATSVDDIVHSAGVAKGTFYLYFKSKSELVGAAVQAIAGELESIMSQAVSSFPDDARVTLKTVLGAQLAYLQENPGLMSVLLSDKATLAREYEISDELLERLESSTTSVYERIIRTGMLQAHFREVDAKIAAVVLRAVTGAMVNDAAARSKPLAGLETISLEFLINGIKRPH